MISVIVPSHGGEVPKGLLRQAEGRSDVEIVSVVGVSPVGKARNEGLRRAKGDYIAWVDSDDEVTEDWLREIQMALAASPDALVFDAHNDGWPCMGDFVYGKPRTDRVVQDVYEDGCLRGHLWRTVTRRSLWEGLSFDETVCAMEDYLLLPRVLMRAKCIAYLPLKLYRYVYHPNSAVSDVRKQRILDALRAAIRRLNEAPVDYREAALKGSLRLAYETLMLLHIEPQYRSLVGKVDVQEGVRFLRRHAVEVLASGRERLRYVCAGFNFWLPQRLAYWYHFGRSKS